MNDLSTVVSQYRASLTAYTDTQFVPVATDKYGRLMLSHDDNDTHQYSSMRLGDGSDLLDIVKASDNVSGSTGLMVFGKDVATELARPIPVTQDHAGNDVIPVAGSIDIDPTPGLDGDKHCDEDGANTEPGVVGSVGTAAYVDVVSIALPNEQYVVQAVHCVADRTAQFRLVVMDGSSIVKVLGNWMIPQNLASCEFTLPRGREISGAANRTIKLQAIRRAVGSVDANVSGRINGFVR